MYALRCGLRCLQQILLLNSFRQLRELRFVLFRCSGKIAFLEPKKLRVDLSPSAAWESIVVLKLQQKVQQISHWALVQTQQAGCYSELCCLRSFEGAEKPRRWSSIFWWSGAVLIYIQTASSFPHTNTRILRKKTAYLTREMSHRTNLLVKS